MKDIRDRMFELGVNTLGKVNDDYTRGELCCAIGGALAYLRTAEYLDEEMRLKESEENRERLREKSEKSEKSEERRREEERRRREWWGEVREILRENRECRRSERE